MSEQTVTEGAPDVTAGGETNPGAAFAAMMTGAADQVAEEAPYGYTKDRLTGEMRPKKSPGRAGARTRSPSLEELQAERAANPGPDTGPQPDRQPAKRSRKDRRAQDKETSPPPPPPPYQPGVIGRGMDRLYRRAGKFVKVMDPDIGTAIIESTRKDDEDDVTVGEAWEELARTNPRVRRFLLRAIAGGAWSQVFAAHAPIFLAILLKDSIRKRIPFAKLIEAMLSDDEDSGQDGEGPADLLGGLDANDLQAMWAMAQNLMGGMVPPNPARPGGSPRPPVIHGQVETGE